MIITVDATGCACPEPVIRTKKAMKEEHDEIVVLVDNKIACENIKRLAKKMNILQMLLKKMVFIDCF